MPRENRGWPNVTVRKVSTFLPQKDVDGDRFTFYPHQVGGHFCLVKPSPNTALEIEMSTKNHEGEHYTLDGYRVLLKPFDEYEFRFYRQLAEVAPSEKPWARSENWAVHCESLGGGGGSGSSATVRTSAAAASCETSVANRGAVPFGGKRPRAASSAMVRFTA